MILALHCVPLAFYLQEKEWSKLKQQRLRCLTLAHSLGEHPTLDLTFPTMHLDRVSYSVVELEEQISVHEDSSNSFFSHKRCSITHNWSGIKLFWLHHQKINKALGCFIFKKAKEQEHVHENIGRAVDSNSQGAFLRETSNYRI